jgi:hypothetical protein
VGLFHIPILLPGLELSVTSPGFAFHVKVAHGIYVLGAAQAAMAQGRLYLLRRLPIHALTKPVDPAGFDDLFAQFFEPRGEIK